MTQEIKELEELSEGDLILCTVDRIMGTIVFVKIFLPGKEIEGSIVFSEVAPGRIRNIRNYVVPKKRIVCKILRKSNNRIDLSLRRVSQKERKGVMDEYKQEKSYEGILKNILNEKAKEIIIQIKKKHRLYDFVEDSKKNPQKLEELIEKENAKKFLEIVKIQKKKKRTIKKRFNLTTQNPKGINLIKNILNKIKNARIKYISAGKYSIEIESEDLKKADNELKEILSEIEKNSKKQEMEFNTIEK